METIEIEGAQYVALDDVNQQVADQLEVASFDMDELKKRHSEVTEELEAKRAEREQIEKDNRLYQHLKDRYSNDIKNIDSFYELAKVKNVFDDDGNINDAEIHGMYKALPKSARKSLFDKFIKK